MGINFVAFDLETTGLSNSSEICQFAFVRFENGVPTSVLSSLVKPSATAEWQVRASQLNGITKNTVANAPNLKDLLPDVAAFIGDSPLVAHNASFDINKWVANGGGLVSAYCTQSMFDAAHPSGGKPSLALATSHYGVEIETAHEAESDATACGQLVVEMALEFGCASLPELARKLRTNKVEATARSLTLAAKGPDKTKSLRKDDFAALSNELNKVKIADNPLSGKYVIFSQLATLKAQDAQRLVALFGGTSLDNVSKRTHFLVVGDLESQIAKPTKKMKDALFLQSNGAKLEIIDEGTFLNLASQSGEIGDLLTRS